MTTFSPSLSPVQSLHQGGFPAELRALGAVVRKQWLIFRRYPSWIISLLVWPIIFPATYLLTGRALAGPDGSGLTLFTQKTGISDFIGFVVIGTTIWMWQNTVLWNIGFALRNEQWRGTLESNWMSPTWRFSFLVGKSVIDLFTSITLVAVTALEYGLFFGVRFHGNLFLCIFMLLAAVPSIYGLGFTFASLVITAKEANTFVFLARGLVMIFCGITYPLSTLPGWMQIVSKWLPQTYMIHGLRNASLAGASFRQLLPDYLALLAFGIVWLVIGYLTFSWMERRARQTGAIGQY